MAGLSQPACFSHPAARAAMHSPTGAHEVGFEPYSTVYLYSSTVPYSSTVYRTGTVLAVPHKCCTVRSSLILTHCIGPASGYSCAGPVHGAACPVPHLIQLGRFRTLFRLVTRLGSASGMRPRCMERCCTYSCLGTCCTVSRAVLDGAYNKVILVDIIKARSLGRIDTTHSHTPRGWQVSC